jgi:hypothetical protein
MKAKRVFLLVLSLLVGLVSLAAASGGFGVAALNRNHTGGDPMMPDPT